MTALLQDIAACRLCADRFADTHTAHDPRPVVWFRDTARILIASQAPGMRVHEAMTPFWDRSGDRLRDWLGIDKDTFYDRSRVAIVPMAFCFPGYDKNGSDLPPPRICAATWRDKALQYVGQVKLTLLIGGYAQNWHLGGKMNVTERCKRWADYAPAVFPLPHPSWRNTGWLNKNPWFEQDVLPGLRARVQEVLT
ncbi:Uracil-DNA glycosylase [Cognatiyoonia koreensis]|uniref:Uracil-DNA glycosylase n=1 Tax=Cognatiyoonia koreensis TaxID=364200 RepID=A0A1I0MSI6_9RHOB|nr:uracil-DNA glycosylase family protein [Cognatiyoonia koreensis]SEV91652.1 Uracil-DNA glycosylase [Cognatiyoonia koreensis]